MKRDLEFLFEIGRLRFYQRSWQRFFNTRVSNDAEHTFRVVWLALMIAKKESGNDVDREKIMKMALVHDINESRSGDVDYISRLYTEQKEEDAIEDMLEDTVFEDEFVKIWKEFEKKETLEAKIVKDADNLDIDLEIMEQMDTNRSFGERMVEARKQIKEKLNTQTGKKLFDEIYATENVHDWHFESKRNCFKSGYYGTLGSSKNS